MASLIKGSFSCLILDQCVVMVSHVSKFDGWTVMEDIKYGEFNMSFVVILGLIFIILVYSAKGSNLVIRYTSIFTGQSIMNNAMIIYFHEWYILIKLYQVFFFYIGQNQNGDCWCHPFPFYSLHCKSSRELSLRELMLTYHQWRPVGFTWQQFNRKYSQYQSIN